MGSKITCILSKRKVDISAGYKWKNNTTIVEYFNHNSVGLYTTYNLSFGVLLYSYYASSTGNLIYFYTR